jgi:hypothetical protein
MKKILPFVFLEATNQRGLRPFGLDPFDPSSDLVTATH